MMRINGIRIVVDAPVIKRQIMKHFGVKCPMKIQVLGIATATSIPFIFW